MMPFDQHLDRTAREQLANNRQRMAPRRRVRLDEKIISRRPWYIVGLALLGVSLVLRDQVLFVSGLAVIALGAIPEFWYRFCLSDMSVRRELGADHAQIGDDVPFIITIENRKLLPLPRLDFDDETPEACRVVGAVMQPSYKTGRAMLTDVFSLWAAQRVVRRYRMRVIQRGAYTFGPLRLRSGDPLGILTREETIDQSARLIVHPLVTPLERLGLAARAPFGDLASPRQLLTDPLRVAGVRQYASGDDPRHIHWKATARTGSLHTKVFEPSAHHTLTIFLDLRTFGRDDRLFGHGQFVGVDRDLSELAISVAASVASWGLEQGYAVGLCANGTMLSDEDLSWRPHESGDGVTGTDLGGVRPVTTRRSAGRLRIAPSGDGGQSRRVLDALARLVAYIPRPIHDIVVEESHRLPYGSTVVYVGAAEALGGEGVEAFSRLRSAGHSVTLLLTGETPLMTRRLPSYRVGGTATWREMLGEALAARGLDDDGQPLTADNRIDVDANSDAANEAPLPPRPRAPIHLEARA
ncbi:MAG TPA: DUF58 domain-containing protein [Ktedonobacterales bacterium]|nr:DUF58 domain-containing protein [Ktedonobacterales bacterium]